MPTKTTIIIHIVVFYYVVLLALFIYIFIHKALKLSGLAYVLLTTKKGEDNEGALAFEHTLHYTTATHTHRQSQLTKRSKQEEEGGGGGGRKTRKEERGRREEVENNEEEGEEEGGKEAKE